MKKTIVLALALSMALAVAGCAKTGEPAATAASEAVSTTAETAQEEEYAGGCSGRNHNGG